MEAGVSAIQVTDIVKPLLGSYASSIKTLLKGLADLLAGVLSFIGIHLPQQGYMIVALVVLVAALYHLQKMTFELLKALVIGVIIAILLHIAGVI